MARFTLSGKRGPRPIIAHTCVAGRRAANGQRNHFRIERNVSNHGAKANLIDRKSRSGRSAGVITALAILLLASAAAVHSAGLLRDASRGYGLLYSDDAYYYVLVARNFVDLGMFSADGLAATNGFHPLWAWLLAGLYSATGTAVPLASQIFHIVALEQFVRALALALALMGVWSWRGRPESFGFAIASLLLVFPPFHIFEMGMESTVAALCAMAALLAWLHGSAWGLGVALALLFFARLDSIVFVAPFLVAGFAASKRASAPVLRAAALPLAAFAAYAIANWISTDHVAPISGALKSSFPFPEPRFIQFREWIEILEQWGWQPVVDNPNLLVLAGLALIGCAGLLRRPRETEDRTLLLACCAIACVQIANLLLFQKWTKSIESWYYALPYLFAGFAAGMALRGWIVRTRAEIVALGGAVAAAATCLWLAVEAWPAPRDADFRGLPEFVQIQALTQPGDILASTDSGALSFWTERRVVNLDGLVNTYAYQRRLCDGRLASYLAESGVKYLAVAVWTEPAQETTRLEPMYRHRHAPDAAASKNYEKYRFSIYSYLYGTTSDVITFAPADEVYRSHLGSHGSADATYVLYRFPPM